MCKKDGLIVSMADSICGWRLAFQHICICDNLLLVFRVAGPSSICRGSSFGCLQRFWSGLRAEGQLNITLKVSILANSHRTQVVCNLPEIRLFDL